MSFLPSLGLGDEKHQKEQIAGGNDSDMWALWTESSCLFFLLLKFAPRFSMNASPVLCRFTHTLVLLEKPEKKFRRKRILCEIREREANCEEPEIHTRITSKRVDNGDRVCVCHKKSKLKKKCAVLPRKKLYDAKKSFHHANRSFVSSSPEEKMDGCRQKPLTLIPKRFDGPSVERK